jgi:hypothetical protein
MSSNICSKVQWFSSSVSNPTNFGIWWLLDSKKKWQYDKSVFISLSMQF